MSKPTKKNPKTVQEILGADQSTVVLTNSSCTVYVDSGCVAWVQLDKKDKSVNVVDISFSKDLAEVLDLLETLIARKEARVVVFYSTKSTFFVGADIKMIYPVTDSRDAETASKVGQQLFGRIQALKVPTLAAINGACLGGGLELCLACTHRVSASAPSIQIGLPEIKLGLLPGAGGTVRLPKIIGLQEALKIILPGGAVSPDKARRLGLVDRVVEAEDRFDNENRFFHNVRTYATLLVDRPFSHKKYKPKTLADRILNSTSLGHKVVEKLTVKNLDKNTRRRYPAPYLAFDSVLHSMHSGANKAFDREAKNFAKLVATPESKNLISIFLLMDESKKRAERTNNAPILDVKKVGVVGAGVMGSGIAQMFAYKDFEVFMKDIKPEFVNNGLKTVNKLFTDLAKRKKLTPADAKRKNALVQGGVSYDGFKDAQLVVEAAVERMDLKKAVLLDCEKTMPEGSIFATNTSSLSIDELASVAKHPENVVGMHFFNPVHRMPLVEIIRGKHTSDTAVATVYQMALELGKIPIIVNDGPGFLVNRVLGIMLSETGRLFQEGGDILTIDKYLRDFGLPMGPFRLMDEVGLDVALHVGPVLEKGLGDRFSQNPGFARLVSAGFLGKKVGKGFYAYKNGKSIGLEPSLEKLVGTVRKEPKNFTYDEVVDRAVLLMVNEAALILEEGIAEKAEDVDLGMIMGTGFAPFRGGLLSYVDYRGVGNIVNRLKQLQTQYNSSRFAPAKLLVKMAENNEKFFPNRPYLPFSEKSPLLRSKL